MPGELPLVLLALLDDGALGGYELLRLLERRFSPTYRPSPGSVYPALTALRAEGLVRAIPGAGKARFRLTAAGRRMLAEQADTLRRVEHRTKAVLRADSSIHARLDRFSALITKLSGRVDGDELERILDNAMTAIAQLEVSNGQ